MNETRQLPDRKSARLLRKRTVAGGLTEWDYLISDEKGPVAQISLGCGGRTGSRTHDNDDARLARLLVREE